MGNRDQHHIDRLKKMKSLREILETASEFERSARDFYRELAPRVSKRIRDLVTELADEEQRHYELFNELMAGSIETELAKRISTPVSDSRFSDGVHLPELGENPDDQAILQFALGREQTAMEQYSKLAEQCEPGAIRDLFSYLADEETKHKLELEKSYYALTHPSAV